MFESEDIAFVRGYKLAHKQIREFLNTATVADIPQNGVQPLPISATVPTVPTVPATQDDDEFIKLTVEWAKNEWPMLRDAVQQRLAAHEQPQVQQEMFISAIALAILPRLSTWLASPDVNLLMAGLDAANNTIKCWNQAFNDLFMDVGWLKDEEFTMQPLERAHSVLQRLMETQSNLDVTAMRNDASASLWAAAGDRMAEWLSGEPEEAQTDLSLLERTGKMVKRLKRHVNGSYE
jgi:hypothetical protein